MVNQSQAAAHRDLRERLISQISAQTTSGDLGVDQGAVMGQRESGNSGAKELLLRFITTGVLALLCGWSVGACLVGCSVSGALVLAKLTLARPFERGVAHFRASDNWRDRVGALAHLWACAATALVGSVVRQPDSVVIACTVWWCLQPFAALASWALLMGASLLPLPPLPWLPALSVHSRALVLASLTGLAMVWRDVLIGERYNGLAAVSLVATSAADILVPSAGDAKLGYVLVYAPANLAPFLVLGLRDGVRVLLVTTLLRHGRLLLSLVIATHPPPALKQESPSLPSSPAEKKVGPGG